MPRSVRGFSRPIRSPRRKTEWAAGPGNGAALQSQYTSTSVKLVNGLFLFAEDVTLVRLRGRLQCWLVSATAAGGYIGAFGLAKSTTAAAAAGIGSVPTPITEQNWDGWLYWTAIQVVAAGAIDSGAMADTEAVHPITAAVSIEVDSKAMRKFSNLDTLYGAMELTELGTSVMDWAFDSRILVKLH